MRSERGPPIGGWAVEVADLLLQVLHELIWITQGLAPDVQKFIHVRLQEICIVVDLDPPGIDVLVHVGDLVPVEVDVVPAEPGSHESLDCSVSVDEYLLDTHTLDGAPNTPDCSDDVVDDGPADHTQDQNQDVLLEECHDDVEGCTDQEAHDDILLVHDYTPRLLLTAYTPIALICFFSARLYALLLLPQNLTGGIIGIVGSCHTAWQYLYLPSSLMVT